MKNSTLLRLFFISIGLPLTCASSSTSSAPTPKSNTASLLVDISNNTPAVQLEGIVTGVPSVSGEISVSGMKDKVSKQLEALISKKQYKEIVELGKKMSDEELLKCLCQVVTSPDHFKGLYGYLEQRKMVPGFLAHGEMVLVREVIVETDLLEINDFSDECDSLYDAIVLSFKEDRLERVAGLFEAAQKKPLWRKRFYTFMSGFFNRYPPEKNSMPLKRFLTLHGEEFSKKHPGAFDTICEVLVGELRRRLNNPGSQKLLIDLVGQPSLLTPVAFARGFLFMADGTSQVKFIEYGYKEAIEEGLKKEYRNGGGRGLWGVMVSKYSTQFAGEYPSTDEARAAALENFKPTKQDREEEWIKANIPILLARLEQLMPGLFPKVLWNLIFEYY